MYCYEAPIWYSPIPEHQIDDISFHPEGTTFDSPILIYEKDIKVCCCEDCSAPIWDTGTHYLCDCPKGFDMEGEGRISIKSLEVRWKYVLV